jgi:sec-independent protein translocase protein TatA
MLFIQNMGLTEWLVILVLVLLLFGGRKIPQLAKDLGQGIREFRSALINPNQTAQVHTPESEPRQQLPAPEEPAVKKKRAPARSAARKPKKKSR